MPANPPSSAGAEADLDICRWMASRLKDDGQFLRKEIDAFVGHRLDELHSALLEDLAQQIKMPPPSLPPTAQWSTTEAAQGVQGNESKPNNLDDLTAGAAADSSEPRALSKESSNKSSESGGIQRKDSASASALIPKTMHKQLSHLSDEGEEVVHAKPCGILGRIVGDTRFEILSALAISTTTILMCIEIQYKGYKAGHKFGYKGYDVPLDEEMPGAWETLQVSGMLFNYFFATELLLRVITAQKEDIWDYWLWFDAVVVTLAFLEMFNLIAVDTKMLRIIRLTRIVRVMRFLRTVRFCDSLWLLMRSIQASFGCLIWSFFLLFGIQLTFGMFLNQLLAIVIYDESVDSELREDVFEYFGSFSTTMITMFEITLANWVNVCRMLMKVSEWYGILIVIYRCMFCFAVVKVIQAVFIAETNKLVAADDEVKLRNKAKAQKAGLKKMQTLFKELDSSDGRVSREEFTTFFGDPKVKIYANTFLDLESHDPVELFSLLDEGEEDGSISMESLFSGLSKLKGPAKSRDLIAVLNRLRALDGKIDRIEKRALVRGEDKSEREVRAFVCL
jgi:hypothetical protein